MLNILVCWRKRRRNKSDDEDDYREGCKVSGYQGWKRITALFLKERALQPV